MMIRNVHRDTGIFPAAAARVVIQARMGSTRFPGKIAKDLGGKPLLAWVVRRLAAAVSLERLVVATSTDERDDATQALCRRLEVACFRGPADDVLARYVAATADLSDDCVVLRATADNPFYCPERTKLLLEEQVRRRASYLCIADLSYVVPEAFTAGALRRMADLARDPYCREHVTPWFRQADRGLRIVQLPADWQGLRPDIRFTVDTPEQLAGLRRLTGRLGPAAVDASLETLYGQYAQLAG